MSGPTDILKKAKFVIFGLEKAKPGNPALDFIRYHGRAELGSAWTIFRNRLRFSTRLLPVIIFAVCIFILFTYCASPTHVVHDSRHHPHRQVHLRQRRPRHWPQQHQVRPEEAQAPGSGSLFILLNWL